MHYHALYSSLSCSGSIFELQLSLLPPPHLSLILLTMPAWWWVIPATPQGVEECFILDHSLWTVDGPGCGLVNTFSRPGVALLPEATFAPGVG